MFGQGIEKRGHFVEFHADGGGVVIRISTDLETCAFKNAAMVVPSRVADVGARCGKPVVQEICSDFKRARTAQGLYSNDAPLSERGVVFAEQQMLHRAAVSVQAFHRQVGRRRRRDGAGGFGSAHRFQYGHLAFVVEINAYAQIDFFGALVAVERFDQTQNWVAGIVFNVSVHRLHPLLLSRIFFFNSTPLSIWCVNGNWSNRAARSTVWVSAKVSKLARSVSGLQEM